MFLKSAVKILSPKRLSAPHETRPMKQLMQVFQIINNQSVGRCWKKTVALNMKQFLIEYPYINYNKPK